MIPSVVFVVAVALQNKLLHFRKFSRNPGSMSKCYTHVLSTLGKFMAGFLVKSFGWCCVGTVLTVACYWPSSQRCEILLDGVKSQPFSVGLRQWCVLLPLLFIVYIRVPHTTPRGLNSTYEASWPGRKTHFANKEKKYIYEKYVDWVEWNISRKNHITQDVGPSNCCAIAYVVSPKKFEEPWSTWTG